MQEERIKAPMPPPLAVLVLCSRPLQQQEQRALATASVCPGMRPQLAEDASLAAQGISQLVRAMPAPGALPARSQMPLDLQRASYAAQTQLLQ